MIVVQIHVHRISNTGDCQSYISIQQAQCIHCHKTVNDNGLFGNNAQCHNGGYNNRFSAELQHSKGIADHCINRCCQQNKDNRYYNRVLEKFEEIRFHNDIHIVIQRQISVRNECFDI